MLKRSSPIFAVTDVKKTITFYRYVLGFKREWYWGDPVTFGGIHLGDVQVMFHQQPLIARHVEGHEHHYWCDNVDDLYKKHRAASAPIIQPIANMPWEVREYRVRDPDGYHLRFSGPTKYEKPALARDSLPEYYRIEIRTPTAREYSHLHKSVGWGDPADPGAMIGLSLFTVVATDSRSEQVIGMLRVMRDANLWFSIWDVMVDPQHQSQRVGSAMIQAALARLRIISPHGGTVHLFATKLHFYERLGFKSEQAMVIRL